jgi:TonB family protein
VRLRTIAALAAVTLLLAVGTASAEDKREQSISWLLDGLKARPRPCPEKIEFNGYAEGATCAEVDSDPKRFPKLLRKTVTRAGKDKAVLLEERKSKDRSLYGARMLLVKGLLLDLYYESGTGSITLLAPLSCLKGPDGGVPVPAHLRPELESPPIVDHREAVVFPAPARRERVGGVVVMDAAIDAEGQVTDSCVLFVSPAGYGFEEAGLSALRQSSFTPAGMGGTPVPAAWRTATTFEIMSPWLD